MINVKTPSGLDHLSFFQMSACYFMIFFLFYSIHHQDYIYKGARREQMGRMGKYTYLNFLYLWHPTVTLTFEQQTLFIHVILSPNKVHVHGKFLQIPLSMFKLLPWQTLSERHAKWHTYIQPTIVNAMSSSKACSIKV